MGLQISLHPAQLLDFLFEFELIQLHKMGGFWLDSY